MAIDTRAKRIAAQSNRHWNPLLPDPDGAIALLDWRQDIGVWRETMAVVLRELSGAVSITPKVSCISENDVLLNCTSVKMSLVDVTRVRLWH